VTLDGQILLWGALWLAGGTLFVLLVRRGMTYVDRPLTIAVFFFVLSVLVALPFRDLLLPRLAELEPVHGVLVLGLVGFQVGTYAVTRRRLPRPERLIDANRHIYFLRMDDRYLVSKSFEILFQQTLLASLVLVLVDAGLSTSRIVIACVTLFAVAHVPLLKLVGRVFGVFYIVSAAVAAAVFPLLIAGVEAGIAYSYVLHSLFYTLAGVAFWMLEARADRLRAGARP
jgi:hypothetical protein